MSSCISCPHCGVPLTININKGNIFYFEPYNYNKKEDKYYAPRGMVKVAEEDYKKQIDFLLGSWADKIIIYDINKKVVETLWK